MHGGKAPQVLSVAAERVHDAAVVAEVERYTAPVEMTAREALAAELARTNGAIAYLARQLDRFSEPPADWLALYQAERAHLARLADRMAVFEQRTAEVEQTIRGQLIDTMEQALRGILADLGHDPDDTVTRELVALHMRRVAQGSSAPTAPAPRAVPEVPALAAPPPPVADF